MASDICMVLKVAQVRTPKKKYIYISINPQPDAARHFVWQMQKKKD